MTVYINGRFLTQPVSGVQRYAREMMGALDACLGASPSMQARLGPVEVLVPRAVPAPGWSTLGVRVVRGGKGHMWEQGALYQASKDDVLVSLGNSGPLRHRAHILCLHDANLFEIPRAFGRRYRVAHRLLRPALAQRAAALLTVSQHSAGVLSHHLGVPADRFTIVPNSAEHVLRWPHAPGVLATYGLTRGRYLLSVGNQSPNKNLGALIAAHELAGPDVPPLVLVGGDVPGVTHAEAGQGTRALGRVPDSHLRALYEGAAAFVFPSLHEGFGIPPLEAMQLGVPVLCARSGAMPAVLGNAPLWFDPLDVVDMARALRTFARMAPSERAAMQVIGKAMAAQYRWDQSARRLAGIVVRVRLHAALAA
ncbi:glycosyltransferase family 1 protein [uncultured Tateyamaria sp.]|uniref:glycosyltransferase family 4 protein n=1 Tax=uncultured Tateyamaria sp. TaxID=455651 RepID=UPI0026200082|nr:glycosyltransferase family 1 protein [uncultured Tateyamaria sp.]